MTIATFSRAVRADELTIDEHTDLILDEANLVGTYDMHDVAAIALESAPAQSWRQFMANVAAPASGAAAAARPAIATSGTTTDAAKASETN